MISLSLSKYRYGWYCCSCQLTNQQSQPDDILAWLFKELAAHISEPLTHAFNACLLQGKYPKNYKYAVFTPLPKKLVIKKVDQKRSISGLLTTYKVFEKSRIRETKHLLTNADSSTDTHPVYFKKTLAAPFGNRSPQLRGAWVCTWADLQNLQRGAAPPHKTETRWTDKEKFLCLSAPLVKAPHFCRLLCWMGLARYSPNYSGCAIGGWTKNTPKPIFFEKRKTSSKTQKLKNI